MNIAISSRMASYQRTLTSSQPWVTELKQKIASSETMKITIPCSQESTPISSSSVLKMNTNGSRAVRMS